MSSSTASNGKAMTLYVSGGPNPWKVLIILEELGLTYNIISLDTQAYEQKKPEFLKLNPNGRLPALIDHNNNDFTIWESGAIILYLIGKYDTDHKISFPDFDTTAIANQYLMFQMSGQGPYYGQLFWFSFYHAEKIPSAISRYADEIRRILSVTEKLLEGKEYLVGNKLSYADLSFVTWNMALDISTEMNGWRTEFPGVAAWHDKLCARESAIKAQTVREDIKKKA